MAHTVSLVKSALTLVKNGDAAHSKEREEIMQRIQEVYKNLQEAGMCPEIPGLNLDPGVIEEITLMWKEPQGSITYTGPVMGVSVTEQVVASKRRATGKYTSKKAAKKFQSCPPDKTDPSTSDMFSAQVRVFEVDSLRVEREYLENRLRLVDNRLKQMEHYTFANDREWISFCTEEEEEEEEE